MIGFESKQEGQLLTLEAFQDMIYFEQMVNEISITTPDNEVERYENYCIKLDVELEKQVSLFLKKNHFK